MNDLQDQLFVVESIYDHLDNAAEVVEWIIAQAADRACRLGLADLYRKSVGLRTLSDAKWFLAACVATIPEMPLMTAAETIIYLRLNTDDRDAAERLRNLIRFQRLPVIRRGRLMLFRRTAVDEWLQGKAGNIMNGRRERPRRKTTHQRGET